MERIYNKLVRDNIPDIIKNNGEEPIIRTLGNEEYKEELYKKLNEETKEVINSKDNEELKEELADVLEVVISLAKLNGSTLDDIKTIADKKRLKRGGFNKKIFLEKVKVLDVDN